MCQYMIQIADSNKERSFYRCEHGTFHLLWGNAVFSLTLEQVEDLKELVVDTRYSENRRGPLCMKQRISPDGVPAFELWMAEVGIKLSSKDCRVLAKLIADTLTWVEKQPPFDPAAHTLAAQRLANMDALPLIFESLSWN